MLGRLVLRGWHLGGLVLLLWGAWSVRAALGPHAVFGVGSNDFCDAEGFGTCELNAALWAKSPDDGREWCFTAGDENPIQAQKGWRE
jgi:hypothetical protein